MHDHVAMLVVDIEIIAIAVAKAPQDVFCPQSGIAVRQLSGRQACFCNARINDIAVSTCERIDTLRSAKIASCNVRS